MQSSVLPFDAQILTTIKCLNSTILQTFVEIVFNYPNLQIKTSSSRNHLTAKMLIFFAVQVLVSKFVLKYLATLTSDDGDAIKTKRGPKNKSQRIENFMVIWLLEW